MDRLPPHSIEAEAGVLGCILRSTAECLEEPLKRLTFGPDAFYDLRHRSIYEAMLTLRERGRAIDAITLVQALKDQGQLEAVGGLGYLASLPDQVPSTANLEYYAEILDEKYTLRKVLEVAQQAAVSVYESNAEPVEIFTGIERTFAAIRQKVQNPPSPWLELCDDAADVMHEQLPPLTEIVSGIVSERSKLVIGSGSKSFKTWLTMDCALSIATGTKFLGRQTQRCRVLYCNFELKSLTFKRRLQAVAQAKSVAVEPDWFLHAPLRGQIAGLPLLEIVNRIIGLARHFQAGVVVIDPVYKVNVEGDENSSKDQTLFFNQLDRITTEAEATVILNDHFSKGNQSEKDPLDAIRGSSAKGGDVDAAMVIRPHEIAGCFRVDMVHRELPPVPPFCIGWEFPLMHLRPELDPEAMKKAKAGRRKAHDPRRLLVAIEDSTAEKPVSISAWAHAAGVARQTLSDYLPDLRTKGLVATVGEGANARQYLTEKGRKMAPVTLESGPGTTCRK